MVAGEAGGRTAAPLPPVPAADAPAASSGGRPTGPPRASASRKSAMSLACASSADSSRSSRKRPNCNRSVRYASSVLRESPRSNSRYARKSSTRCSKRRSTIGFSIVATPECSGACPSSLAAAQERPQPQQTYERLRVAAVPDHAVELGQRHLDDLDALVLVRVGALVEQARGHEDVALLGREARRRIEARQMLPRARALADLLGELALRGVERALAIVELAGRQLEQRRLVDRLARLRDEVHPSPAVRHDPDRAGVLHDLALGLLAVVVAEAVDADPAEPPLPGDL